MNEIKVQNTKNFKNMQNMNQLEQIDLLELAKYLLGRAWIIILAGLITGALALFYSISYISPVYQAETLLYVNNNNLSVGSITLSSSDLTASQNLASLYNVILQSRSTLNAVIKDANLTYTADQLKGMVSSSSVGDTAVLSIKVKSTDPDEAEKIADSIARVLPDKIDEIIDGSSARILDNAVKPQEAISPNNKKNALIGVMLGAGAVSMIFCLLFLLDNTIHDLDDLKKLYDDIPVLGTIPDHFDHRSKPGYYYYTSPEDKEKHTDISKSRKARKLNNECLVGKELTFEVEEAYKLVRTNLDFFPVEEERGKVIAFTSPTKGEGKTTTALNLAYEIAQEGKSIVILEADLRMPKISSLLKIEAKTGLSELLAKKENDDHICLPYQMGDEEIYVIPSGSTPPNPSELLASDRMKALIQELSRQFDYVLLDLPPVNVVSDCLGTRDYVDGIVMVVRYEYCEKSTLAEAMRRVQSVNMKVLGFVLNDKRQDRNKYGYYKRNSYYKKYGKYYKKEKGSKHSGKKERKHLTR